MYTRVDYRGGGVKIPLRNVPIAHTLGSYASKLNTYRLYIDHFRSSRLLQIVTRVFLRSSMFFSPFAFERRRDMSRELNWKITAKRQNLKKPPKIRNYSYVSLRLLWKIWILKIAIQCYLRWKIKWKSDNCTKCIPFFFSFFFTKNASDPVSKINVFFVVDKISVYM